MDFAETIRGIFGGQSSQSPPSGDDYAEPLRPMVEPTGSRRPKLSLSIPKPPEHDPVLGEELHKILADSASEAAALRTRESVRPTGGREEGGATALTQQLPGALIAAPFHGIAQGADAMRRVFGGELDPLSPEGIGEGINAAMQVMGQSPFAARGSLGAGGGKLVQPGYHGSPRTDLDVIKASPESRQFDNATSQFGAFFAPTEGAAKRYAGDTGRVYKTDLDLKNPYEMPWSEFNAYQSPHKGANGESLFEGGENALKARAEELKVQAAQHRRELEGLGHDGIVVRNSRGEPIEIASFNDVKTGGVEDMIKAYHGSPHDFERFDLSKIGTGEGAQAYGHGLYFAENERVAKGYRDALSGGAKPGSSGWIVNGVHHTELPPPQRAAIEAYGKTRDPSVLNGTGLENAVIDAAPAGKMYEVGIRANPEHFLDWDKPLSEQHPKVRDTLLSFPEVAKQHKAQTDFLGPDKGLTGASAYSTLANWKRGVELSPRDPVETTAKLREAGIPGIKYLDQGSRDPAKMKELANDLAQYREAAKHWEATGNTEKLNIANKQIDVLSKRLQETRNYVVFDDKLIDILKKYGIAGIGALPAMNAFHYQDKQ